MKAPLDTPRLLIETVAVLCIAGLIEAVVRGAVAPGLSGAEAVLLDIGAIACLAAPLTLWRFRRAMRRAGAERIDPPRTISRRGLAVGAVVVTTGMACTVAAVAAANKAVVDGARAQFNDLSGRLVGEVARRVNQPVYGLRGVAGLYAGTDEVPRQRFRAFVEAANLATDYPGALGVGFMERVPRSDAAAYAARERLDDAPGFEIRTLAEPGSPMADWPDLYVIRQCFPQERNRQAWGLDVGSEAVRRAAIEDAARTGEPRITGVITLVQDDLRRPGFLHLVPVYTGGDRPRTAEERVARLRGLAYVPMLLDEALAGLGDMASGRLSFGIYDGERPSDAVRLFGTDGEPGAGVVGHRVGGSGARMFESATGVRVGGRVWTVTTGTTPAFEAGVDRSMPLVMGVGGGALTLLAAAFGYSLATGRARALGLAQGMTDDLARAKSAAEAALRETAAFRSTLDQHSIISVADRRGRIVDANPQFCAISGFAREELLGRDHRVLNSGVHPREFWVGVWRTLAAGRAWRGEVCNRAKDGSLYWVDSIIAPFLGPDGAVEKYVSIRTDITARKLAEEELRRATGQLQLATRAGGVGTWVFDVAADRLAWDEQMYRLYGLDRGEFGGTYEAWRSALHPDDRARADAEIRAALSGEREFDTEFRVTHPGGDVRTIRAISLVHRDGAGRPLRMVGTNWDVTDERAARARLSALTSSLEEAQAVARMGNWSYDLLTGRIAWSRQLYALFERSEGDGPPDYAGVMSDYDADSARRLDAAVRRTAADGTPYSVVLRTSKSGPGARHVRGEGRARRDASGRIVGLYGTATDVTAEIENAEALRVARAQAEAASRAKSEFLANMSHEIRTPLTAILGFADLLREDGDLTRAPAQRLAAIDTIRGAGTHLLSLINDILDLSKIEAGKMTVERVETPLARVFEEVGTIVGPRAAGKGVAFVTALATPAPERLVTDPTRLRQILMNLAGNAVKFTEAGAVTLTARVRPAAGGLGPRLEIDVEDTGPGMHDEEAARLFEPFTQADATVSRRHGGTGLGLAICRRLARLLGGDVSLVRTAPGRGSCFRLDLPLEPAPGAPLITRLGRPDAEPPRSAAAPAPLSGRVLLAEDGVDNQRLVVFHLRRAGARVDVAEHGRAALELIERAESAGDPYDLLLTDIQMPVMDGYALARELRARASDLPIVALTAHAMADDQRRCLEAGCDGYASKPIDKDQLLATCARWIGRRSARPAA